MRRAFDRVGKFFVFAAAPLLCEIVECAASTNSFVNFETPPVHPLALSPDGRGFKIDEGIGGGSGPDDFTQQRRRREYKKPSHSEKRSPHILLINRETF